MELLAQCSHALYNEELLFAKQKIYVLEREKREREVPRINYNNKSEWKHAVNTFENNVRDYILNEQCHPMIPIGEYITRFKNKYCNELNQLTRNETPRWCERKSHDLGRLINVAFSGLEAVKFAGRGSFPFTDWRIQDFCHYVSGIVQNFENEYEMHLYAGKHGWLEQIPYYHCICCDQPIDGLCVMIAMRRYPDMNKRCISCIKKIFNAVTKMQAIWRGYKYRL